MRIGIPRETAPGETRVSLVPSLIPLLLRRGHEVLVERGAGERALFHDDDYARAGAGLVDARALYEQADAILKVHAPLPRPEMGVHEAELIREHGILIGFLSPFSNTAAVRILAARNITSFSMEFVPRITRAQSMDALSSMATVAGYKAVLLAADHLPKMFPLLMTAAGTVPPANVLVLGAGVAGLQAIATSRRLGAKVEAFDPRPAVKEQVKSLGAGFIEMEVWEEVETAGGYAREQSEDSLQSERRVISQRLPRADVVITAAQVFGKRAPVLISAEMVGLLRPGSVIVDLAAEQGGNCELTQAGKTIEHRKVVIIGAVNLAAAVAVDASRMYARNVTDLFLQLFPDGAAEPDFQDRIARESCITHRGRIVNELVRGALGEREAE